MDVSGNLVADVYVWAQYWNGSWGNYAGGRYISDYDNGQYSIGGLAAGAYRVCFRDATGTYPYECYNDVADVESADDVPVTAGSATSDINAQLGLAGDSERERRLQLYLRTIISTL